MNERLQQHERRKFARLDLALTIGYRIVGSKPQAVNEDPLEGLSSDVSLGGLRLMTPTPLDNGTQLELTIALSEDHESIKAQGEVVWQTKLSATSFETGVLIKGMSVDDRSRFMSFVFDQMSKVGA